MNTGKSLMDRRVVVLGDSVLDVWLCGTAHRLSREGPVPVVDVNRRDLAPGAAANTAANLAAMGARVEIVTTIGDDDVGRSLLEQLRGHGVGTDYTVTMPGWTTPSKHRVVAADHLLVRWDHGDGRRLTPAESARLADELADASKSADALVICDYDGAVGDKNVRAAVQRLRSAAPLLVVDAHHLDRWAHLRPDLVTPDASEAAVLLTDCEPPPDGPARVEFFTRHRNALLRASGAAAVVVTLDRDGTLVIDGDRQPHRTLARPAPDEHCAGAGDTFTAAITIGLVRGWSTDEAADYAQMAANIVTAQPGTAVCSAAQIEQAFRRALDAPMTHEQLAQRIAKHRNAGQRIVFTNGCFDVLHRGHVAYLSEAKAAGDVLVVAINSDESVRALKGPERPINSEADRAAVLNALECVDYVTVFNTDTPAPLIRLVKPDLYVKGGDYTPEMLSETAVVRSYGGEVRILGYVADHSTTETIQRIRAVDAGDISQATR
jgi:D-beta-D-heptose 7-phosphate kinase / D-beta-D-heptose 1-phosphate adenosyltransferase